MRKRKAILITAFALILLLGALILDSSCRIVTTEHTVSSENLPESFDGFTVLQLSDIHGRCFGKDNGRLLRNVEKANPDIIVITGDLADEKTKMGVIDSLLEASQRLPIPTISAVTTNGAAAASMSCRCFLISTV